MSGKLLQSLFLVLICFSVLIYIFYSSSFDNIMKLREVMIDLPVSPVKAKFNRFIRLERNDVGGLGNQMYRLASLYGIGRVVDRTPALNAASFRNQWLATEFETLFPHLFESVAFKTVGLNDSTERSSYGSNCCSYDNITNYVYSNATWQLLNGEYYQSYKYFHDFQSEIQGIFKFGPKVMQAVHAYALDLFAADKSHKLCVHIRRGDFIDHPNLESRTDFIVPAVRLIHQFLHNESRIDEMSLVFIGIEPDFWDALNVTQNFGTFNDVYKARLSSRGEDLAFGATYCDSILISASGSTYAWWMAYLGKSTMPVFYNGQVGESGKHPKDVHAHDMFLPEWHKLALDKAIGEVRFDKLWYFEKEEMQKILQLNASSI